MNQTSETRKTSLINEFLKYNDPNPIYTGEQVAEMFGMLEKYRRGKLEIEKEQQC